MSKGRDIMKTIGKAVTVLLAAALSGCGGGGGSTLPTPIERLAGTWEKFSQSTDGGATFEDASTPVYRLTFYTDSTWTDTDGKGGTVDLRGDLMIGHETGNSDPIYHIWALEANDTQLRLVQSDENGQPVGRHSVYAKITTRLD